MRRILYISTARTAMQPGEILSVLDASRRNNARDDVSGLLIVGGRRFLQALEGPDQQVLKTFARISRDDRHFAIVTLNDSPISDRAFAGWHMGYMQGSATSKRTIAEQVADIVRAIPDPTLRAYFTGFVGTQATAA